MICMDICIDKGYAFYGVVSADSVAISNWVDQTGAAYLSSRRTGKRRKP